MRSMLFLSALVALAMIVAGPLAAQVAPAPGSTPAGFDGPNGLAGGDNGLRLEVFSFDNSTDVDAMDNTADVGLGQQFSMQLAADPYVAGSGFALAVSPGVHPLFNPVGLNGDIFLDVAGGNISVFLNGISTIGTPQLGATTAGPGFVNTLFLNADPLINSGQFFTVQGAVFDPASVGFVAFTNPVVIGFAPGVFLVNNNIQGSDGSGHPVTGAPASVIASGFAAGDTVIMPGEFGPAPPIFAPGAPSEAIVLSGGGTLSGVVDVNIGGFNSAQRLDSINDFIAIVDGGTLGGGLQVGPGPLALAPDAGLFFGTRATGQGALLSGQTDTWNVALLAGDIIEVEVYSVTDATATQITDGFGNGLNPLAAAGFDPTITLQATTNIDPLTFDPAVGGATTPNLHFNDDAGPGGNARITFQVPAAGTYNLIVGDAFPAAFVTGDYLINVLVRSNRPAVAGFNDGAVTPTRVNVVQNGGTVRVLAPNTVVGQSYDVTLRPVADASFTSRVVAGVPCLIAGELDITIPVALPTDQPIGLHRVSIIDPTLTGLTLFADSLEWNNSAFTPGFGVLPDLLSIAGSTITPAVPNTGFLVPTTLNDESFVVTDTMGFLGQGQILAPVPGPTQPAFAYCETLGLNPTNQFLFDCVTDFTAGTVTMIDTTLDITTGGGVLAFDDDDGFFPFDNFGGPLGIGLNSAVITPAPAIGANVLFNLRQTNFTFGGFANKVTMMNAFMQ